MKDPHSTNLQKIFTRICSALLICATILPASAVWAQTTSLPPAKIVNDEGGPVSVSGQVNYTNAFFTLGVAEPMVILEDEAGFVDRNKGFLLPKASQVLGQITSDFFTSPFSYTISLPIEPQASLRDVDENGAKDKGVMVYAVAYWTNTFGDPFLEERDLYGGGWSTAYASTDVSEEGDTKDEIVGGKLLVYAPDAQQGFPSDFGTDGKLFTKDDPIVGLPQGYTIVDLDSHPFTFDRTRHPTINLIEPAESALADFSALSYSKAFDAMVEKMRKEYAWTDYKHIDWDAKAKEFRPRFEKAEADKNGTEYLRALRDFAWSIPDGHVSGPSIAEDFQMATGGGVGLAIRDLDDGRTIVNFVTKDSPADRAGIKLKAQILQINDTPVEDFITKTVAWSAPFSTEHFKHLQQLRYALRAPLGTNFTITYKNPGDSDEKTVKLTTVSERESFNFSSFNKGLTGFETPLEYKVLDNGYGYVKIYGFADNAVLTIQLWERMLRTLNQDSTPGLIIDMRQNGGGSGFLADQMAAYFFNEPLKLGNTGAYDKKLDKFYFDPRTTDRYYLPAEDLRYNGKIAVLVGPNCASACEFFSYDMTIKDRAAIVGQYPTAGMGGSVNQFKMPEDQFFQFTVGRAVDMNGNIHIEGKGVAPTVKVPVSEETLFGTGDPILDAGTKYLDDATKIDTTDGGKLAIGDAVTGTLAKQGRVQYELTVKKGDVITITADAKTSDLDPVLRLYDAGQNQVLENDNPPTGDSKNALIDDLEIPSDMTLTVEVGSVGDTGVGDYTLKVVAKQ
ncbi:MAG: S41 family peptidase [Chloroflexi bacterium]|nr:S41 family peptidase [Chloroflexota bacterium]